MPTPTYTLIQEQVLGSAAASVTFSSIPGTYKDIVLECVTLDTAVGEDVMLRFNSDTGNNYSRTVVYGTGTTAASARNSNINHVPFGSNFTTALSTNIGSIMSYANTNVNKTLIYRSDTTAGNAGAQVSLWRSTAAITSILVLLGSTGQFATGSTFRLWGVSG